MKKGNYFLWGGLALLIVGAIAAAMSQFIIEDALGMERPFGEEPLSIQVSRYGLGVFLLGLALMVYVGWRNRR